MHHPGLKSFLWITNYFIITIVYAQTTVERGRRLLHPDAKDCEWTSYVLDLHTEAIVVYLRNIRTGVDTYGQVRYCSV